MMKESMNTNMKDYYTYRKTIELLYSNDVNYSGDLAGSLLGIREKKSSIESMSLEIQDYTIRIELIKDCNVSDIGSIFSEISSTINNFIINNIDRVTDSETSDKIKSDILSGKQYFDISHVGSMIEINL